MDIRIYTPKLTNMKVGKEFKSANLLYFSLDKSLGKPRSITTQKNSNRCKGIMT